MAVAGHQIGKALCDALGLPKHTKGFTLRCYTGEILTVDCEYYPDLSASLATELAMFNLVRKPEPVQAPVAPSLDFDAWMKERTERAHGYFMWRTARLPR